jgi:hypothetical protein
MRSLVCRIPDSRSISLLNAVTETGVDWMLSSDRRAVTTISSVMLLDASGELACASCTRLADFVPASCADAWLAVKIAQTMATDGK